LVVVPALWAARGHHIRRLLADSLFPYPAASPELLQRIEEFLSAAPRDPALTRILVEHRDMVERALRSRELPA
jgi:aminopeptidase N